MKNLDTKTLDATLSQPADAGYVDSLDIIPAVEYDNCTIGSLHMKNHMVTQLKSYDHVALGLNTATQAQTLSASPCNTLNIIKEPTMKSINYISGSLHMKNSFVSDLNCSDNYPCQISPKKAPDDSNSFQDDHQMKPKKPPDILLTTCLIRHISVSQHASKFPCTDAHLGIQFISFLYVYKKLGGHIG